MDLSNLGTFSAIVGAVVSVIFPGIASATAVGWVGQSAAGVVTEDPDKFGQVLLLQALPGTQGIYGFLAAFMIMLRIGVFGQMQVLTLQQGIMFLLAALPITIVGWKSALMQAKVSMAAVYIVAERPEEIGKALTFPAMVETYAVLAFLASLLMITRIPL